MWRFKDGDIKTKIEKIAEVKKGVKVDMLDLQGNYIKTYDKSIHAARELNISNSGIVTVCKGRQKTAAGFKWRYSDMEVING